MKSERDPLEPINPLDFFAPVAPADVTPPETPLDRLLSFIVIALILGVPGGYLIWWWLL